MNDICCVGILVADILVKNVDLIPDKGKLNLVDSIEVFTGGNAMTAAVNLSKIGLKSAVIGKIGDDLFGNFLVSVLKKHNVNIDSLVVDKNSSTSSSVVLSSNDGERTFLHNQGSNGLFSIYDIDWDVIKQSKIVFVSGTYLLNTFDGEQTAKFLKRCKELGKITALDVCWDSKNQWNTLLIDSMPYIDYFMPSIDEAMMISKESDVLKIASIFQEIGAKYVVIKMGRDGCFIKEPNSKEGKFISSFSGVKVVDTTGAGDSFCSGFLSAIIKDKDFETAVIFGNAVGAMCVAEKGASSGCRSFLEIEKYIEENYND